MNDDCVLNIDMRSFGKMRMSEHIELTNSDLYAVNTESKPMNVAPSYAEVEKTDSGRTQVKLKPLSWNVLRFICEI